MGILLESPNDLRDVKGDKKDKFNNEGKLKYLMVTKVASLREGVSWQYYDNKR